MPSSTPRSTDDRTYVYSCVSETAEANFLSADCNRSFVVLSILIGILEQKAEISFFVRLAIEGNAQTGNHGKNANVHVYMFVFKTLFIKNVTHTTYYCTTTVLLCTANIKFDIYLKHKNVTLTGSLSEKVFP